MASPSSLGPAVSDALKPKTILVLYYTRGVYPLRNTIETHLYCWRRYSKHKVVYVNLHLGFPRRLLERLSIDVVIFHTIFLSQRAWSPSLFQKYTKKCSALKALDCMKIAMPQDEFLNTEMLNDFILDFGVTDILTCASESDWPMIYDKIDRSRVRLRTVLTGYLDPDTVDRIDQRKREGLRRDIDVGYRAWKPEYWLGEHGQHKAWIAEVFEAACNKRGLKSDISMRNEDVLAGDAWFRFLLRCQATLGVAGGASVLDKRGEIKRRVGAYLAEHPGASFEQVRRECFPGEDHKLGLACISPRHLEACATETLQFLVVDGFNGILQPWRHYVPIEKDYSNVEDALEVLADHERVREITTRAYREIVASGRWSYRDFVRDLERDLIDPAPRHSARRDHVEQRLVCAVLRWRDRLGWAFIRFEAWFLSHPERRRLALRLSRLWSRLS